MEGAEQTKIKYSCSGHTLRYPLNMNLNINNKNQYGKIVTRGRGLGN
jgi:hypothetical protein